MTKQNKGAKYKCKECGVVVVVDEQCGCEPCDLVCCGVSMVEVAAKGKTTKKRQSSALGTPLIFPVLFDARRYGDELELLCCSTNRKREQSGAH